MTDASLVHISFPSEEVHDVQSRSPNVRPGNNKIYETDAFLVFLLARSGGSSLRFAVQMYDLETIPAV